VAYLVRALDADAGVMISASHNSVEFNGIKLFASTGYKLPDAVEEEIEALILDTPEKIALQSHTNVGRMERYLHAKDDYIQHIIDSIPTRFDGMKIALDCANGSASATAEKLFTALGATVSMLSAEPDGTNINDHCGSTHMEQLMAYVPAHGCDLGLAFDGDADRCLAVDETGKLIDGDQIIAICAKALHDAGKLEKETAVVTIMSNLGFFHFAKREGIHTVSTKVGDRYVLEEMKKEGYCIGGEQSGHIIFLEHATTGDGELSGAKLAEIVVQSGKKPSELASAMETFPQQMQNVIITPDCREHWKTDAAVCAVMEKYEALLGEDGRILVRESGTEPLIRVMVEAKDAALMQEAVTAIAEEIERYTKRVGVEQS
jgi:phosphoglucosamine mutase